MQIEPIGGCIGAAITDITVDDLLDETIAARVLDALEQWGVLVFRGLEVDDETQVAFSRMLGEPERFPMDPARPEIMVVSLDPERTPAAGYLRNTIFWHIDGATDDIPNKATMLRAINVADDGGDTEFSNTYAAWDALSDDEKARYRHVKVLHTFEAAQRKGTPEPSEEELGIWRMRPGKTQPLAWKHESGRISLVLGATADLVEGMGAAEGKAILAELEAWATRPEFTYRHQWQPGDLVIWDNRGTMHRAVPYEPTSGRLMHRTTLVGEEAFA